MCRELDQQQKQGWTKHQTNLSINIEENVGENTQKSIYGILKTHATETSTAHGIPIIFKSKRWYSKLFWTLVVLVALGAFGKQAYDLIWRYYDYPVAVEVSFNNIWELADSRTRGIFIRDTEYFIVIQ